MGIPQWIIAALLFVQVCGGFLLDGKPRTPYNGALVVCEALLLFALLAWGGFFHPLI